MRCGTAENTGGAPAPMLNDISVLRTAARPYQGLVLGKGRLHPAVQATGTGRVPMAALGIRGEDANAAAVPLAHGRSKN